MNEHPTYHELLEALETLRLENQVLRREIDHLKVPPSKTETAWSTDKKLRLYRSLFRGREDVYAIHFENQRSGKRGYRPSTRDPRLKAPYRPEDLCPLTDGVIYRHLKGELAVGLYPLLVNEETHLLAIDFDKSDWLADALAYLNTSRQWGIPGALERSRSGNGAHVWLFFDAPVPAVLARQLGARILTTSARERGVGKLESYDRFFPNQDTMPKGRLGNLIALPLQGEAVQSGNALFIQDDGIPFDNQWEFLQTLRKITRAELDEVLLTHPGEYWEDLGLLDPNRLAIARSEPPHLASKPYKPLDRRKRLTLIINSRLSVPTKDVPAHIQYGVAHLAAFPNPEFFRRQRLHFSTWNTPRILSLADELDGRLALPRALADEAIAFLEQQGFEAAVEDQRTNGTSVKVRFRLTLWPEQQLAAQSLAFHDSGILDAATSFGKTVVAAWLIAQKQVNTLVVVPNRVLLAQWMERLKESLELPTDGSMGQIGGGEKRPSGIIDVGTLQTLSRPEGIQHLSRYGMVIFDECHHLASPRYEQLLQNCPAYYRFGLSATPLRKDGHHPIIFMHLGPIRFTYDTKQQVRHSPYEYRVKPRYTKFVQTLAEEPNTIQTLFKALAYDAERNSLIAEDIRRAVREGRVPLVLTQRTGHRDTLAQLLGRDDFEVVVLKSHPKAEERKRITQALDAPISERGRVILSTGRLLGEGFDLPRLDTLFLAAPVSWKNVLKQYVGRLHRTHPDKNTIVVYDYVDADVPQLWRMYQRRHSSYRSFGYVFVQEGQTKEG